MKITKRELNRLVKSVIAESYGSPPQADESVEMPKAVKDWAIVALNFLKTHSDVPKVAAVMESIQTLITQISADDQMKAKHGWMPQVPEDPHLEYEYDDELQSYHSEFEPDSKFLMKGRDRYGRGNTSV